MSTQSPDSSKNTLDKPVKIAIGSGVLLVTLLAGLAIGRAGAEVVAPEACTDALDHTEEIAQINADLFKLAGQQSVAAAANDVATLDRLNDQVTEMGKNELAPEIAAYNADAEECRG